MRIGLNATCFNDRPSGAKQRFCGIYGELIRRRPDTEFVIYEPADCRVGSWFHDAPNVTIKRTPLPSTGRIRRTLAGLAYWRYVLLRDRLDLFETFNLPLVRAPACPTILTVHDARPVLVEVPWLKRILYSRILKAALRNADHVVTVSQTMKQEIEAIEPSANVTAIYNGIDPKPLRSVTKEDAEEIGRRFRLPDGFILAVGHLETRKNYPRLIEAVTSLNRSGTPISLVVVGNDGGDGWNIDESIRQAGAGAWVKLLRGVTDAELAGLYRLCALVVFPSYYEGFGIPVLEAMAASRPLALSDTPVFRELTEGVGVYFPPHDSDGIAAAIAGMLRDGEQRRSQIAYGNRRVEAFSFSTLAAELDELYRRLSSR